MSYRLSLAVGIVASLALVPFTRLNAQGQTEPIACQGAPAVATFRGDSVPDLVGIWDFSVDMRTTISSGTMALGRIDNAYGGALTPDATTTVVIRRLTLHRDSVHMAVASAEGDVLFAGRLIGAGDAMCGIVTYHQGAKFTMTARKRPRAQRAPGVR